MIIYKVTNKVNGKIYIGQTTKNLEYRRKKHEGQINCKKRMVFHRAIVKYGKENFQWETICEASNREELDVLEVFYIKQYESFGKNGYNMTEGGNSGRRGKATEETKKKLSLAHMGNKHSKETCDKMSKTRKGKNPNWINPTVNVKDEQVINFVREDPKRSIKDICEYFKFSQSYFYLHYKGKRNLL